MVNFFALGGVGSYTKEVQFSTAETGIGETEEVSGHSSAGSPQILPRQAVAGTPMPKKIGLQALSSAGKKGALRAKGKSSAIDTKTTEDDILRLRKRKLQLENVKLRLEIKKLRKDLEN